MTNPWVLINVAAPAAAHHLRNHNGAPDDRDYLASDPNSPLDANCDPRGIQQLGGRIIIELLSADTFLQQSELWLFAPGANPGPDQTPLDGTNQRYIFRNYGAVGVPSNAPDAGAGDVSNAAPYIIPAGTFPLNTPLHFGLFVNNLYNVGFTNPQDNRTRGAWFYTGGPSANFDGAPHTLATPVSDNATATVYELGFEDLCLQVAPSTPAVCANTLDVTDNDWNDIVFRVTVEKI